MENKTITLELTVNEVKDILNVLGELPTKSNAWPLAMRINSILAAHTEEKSEDAE